MNFLKKFLKKNWLLLFCIIIIFLQFAQIFYFKRALFLHPYNASYWKDRFEHSQYTLPVSKRIIGDDGLYSYAGYRLIHGASIESVISDKPPVGIYTAGLSILLFKNPLWGELLLGIGAIICFYLLTFELLKDKKLALMTTTMFALEPFIFSTFSITLLDLPQLFFLLLHLLLLSYVLKNKKYGLLLALLSGISLGLFAETKPPILLPIIIALEGLWLYKEKYLSKIIPIALGFLIGALTPYFRYFQTGHNLIEYLKLHKYMASIYLSGHNQVFPLSIWQSLLIGYFPDVVSGKLTKIGEWWIFLPIATIIGTLSAIKTLFIKKHSVILKGLAVLMFALLVIYTLIPTYARYLVLIIPFLYIFTALLLKKHVFKPILLITFILFAITGFFYSSYLLLPSDDALQGFKYNFSHQYFQDIYQEDISTLSRKPYSEQQFRKLTQGAMINATIKEVNFKELSRSIPLIGKTGQVKYLVTYTTQDLGKFSEEKTIQLVNENGQWKIIWNWNLLLNSYLPGDTFSLRLIPGKRGTVYNNKGGLVAYDATLLLISVNPDKIDTKREQQMLKLINKVTLPTVYLQNAYLENPLPDTYAPIATTFVLSDQKEQNLLNSYPGIQTTPHESRIYSGMIRNTEYDEYDTKIYSSSNYHGVSGIEKKYDKELSAYNGGALLMTDENRKTIRTLISRQPKNGKNIVIPLVEEKTTN